MTAQHYVHQIETTIERYGVSKENIAALIAKDPDGPFVREIKPLAENASIAVAALNCGYLLTAGGLIYRSCRELKAINSTKK
jgi:hypothetical protein